MKDNKKDVVQQKALKAWINKGKTGTCEIITGLGKTFISLHALYTMPKDSKVHLFLAEATDRKKDLMDDIIKYNKIFKKDVLADYNLEFYCYQTAYKWRDKDFGLVIADEIHDALSPAYSQFFIYNGYDAIIGLSATIIKNTRYEIEGNIFTKGDLLDKFAPICFSYGMDEGQNDGTARKLDVYVISNKLNAFDKDIKAGNKTKVFYQTEKAAYDYWDSQHKRAWFIVDDEKKQLKIRITAHKRSQILYKLNSKVKAVKALLKGIDSKTIVFGNSIETLLKVTKNVVSSKNTDEENSKIRYNFESDKISVIGSFKKLKQGANLTGLDNCIIMSYYGTDKDLIQRMGRLRQNGTIGNVFIFVTTSTQEEVWFSKMFEKVNNLNLIYCSNVEDCLNKLKKIK
jgi:superfamily II DNA or RNA helicase